MRTGRWELIDLDENFDERGSLFTFENQLRLNFDFARIYFLSSNSKLLERGSHAHKNLMQFMIAVGAETRLHLNNGFHHETITLKPLVHGLYVEGLVWRDIKMMSTDSFLFVGASAPYDENDYVRSYSEFLSAVREMVR